jgi:hypothetical protein
MKWPGKKNKKVPHLWDFEGRCVKCHKHLKLYLKVVGTNEVILTVEKCQEHPDNSLILWPQRDDVIRLEEED